MAQLTFPIGSDGLVVDVLVNLEAVALLALRAAGQSRPPIQGKGLIDTGSNVSGVSRSILQHLGAPPVSQSSTTGIGGPVRVHLYRTSLHVWDQRDPGLPWMSQLSRVVMDLAPGVPFDVLIGMDVLLGCTMTVYGPAGRFTLDF